MATANPPARKRRRRWPLVLLVLLAVAVAALWPTLIGYARVGSAYGAHVACSCRYAGGRGLADCKKDFEPGMALVFLSDDPETKSVTARVPLLASATARYREGFGCLLEPWKD